MDDSIWEMGTEEQAWMLEHVWLRPNAQVAVYYAEQSGPRRFSPADAFADAAREGGFTAVEEIHRCSSIIAVDLERGCVQLQLRKVPDLLSTRFISRSDVIAELPSSFSVPIHPDLDDQSRDLVQMLLEQWGATVSEIALMIQQARLDTPVAA